MPALGFNAVIWAAVSTRPQASRDVSIPDQVARARAWLATRGYTEAHAPVIVPGESRQTLVSLSDAEVAIPQFKELLDLAEQGAVNLCVISDTDRFRGLLDQVVRALGTYGCQVYSLAQPVELTAPDEFRYYENDAQLLTFGLAQLMSHADIARFQRKRAHGMATRVDKRGLPPAHIPFGYRKPAGQEANRAAVPVIVESERVVLMRMKADYMAGKPLKEIAGWLNAEGVPGRLGGVWRARTVSTILANPFYAGLLRRNMTRTRADPRTRKRIYHKVAPDQWIIAQGRHEALWSWDEHQAVLDAMAKRRRDNRGAHRAAHFSRLLRCAHCRSAMSAWRPAAGSGYADFRLRYICSQQQAAPHAKLLEEQLQVDLRAQLEEIVRRQLRGGAVVEQDEQAELTQIQRALDACEAKRTRHEQAHGDGLMSLERLGARLAEVEAEESRLLKQRQTALDRAARQQRAARSMDQARAFLARYDEWMAGAPQLANAALREFIDYVVVSRDGVVEVKMAG